MSGRKISIAVCALVILAPGCASRTIKAAPTSSAGSPDTYFTAPVPIGVKADQPGFSTDSNGVYAGFDIDLAHYLADQLKFARDSFQTVDDLNRASALGTRVRLVIATYSITSDREAGTGGDPPVDFAGPYMKTPDGLLVKQNSALAHDKPDLTGRTICTLQGSTAAIADLPANIHKVSEPNYSGYVQDVENGKADAVFTDWLILYGYAQDSAQYPGLVVEHTQYGSINQYGIGIPPGHSGACQELVDKVTSFLKSDQWATDFINEFPGIRQAEPNWQQDFRPQSDTVSKASYCR